MRDHDKQRFSIVNFLVLALLFIGLPLAYTFPLALDIKGSFFGVPHDNVGGIIDMWGLRGTIRGELNLEQFDYINFPDGRNIKTQILQYTTIALNYLAAALIQSPIRALNILLLLKFTLAGVFMYLALRRLVSTKLAAVIGAVCFMFNPFMVSVTKAYGHGFVTFGLPLVLWAALAPIDRRQPWRYLLGLSLAYLVFFGENFYYTYFASATAISTILLGALGYALWRVVSVVRDPVENQIHINWRQMTIGIGVAIAVVVAVVVARRVFYVDLARGADDIDLLKVRFSGDVRMFMIPAVDNWLWSKELGPVYHDPAIRIESYEITKYLGIVPILLTLWAWSKWRAFNPTARVCLIAMTMGAFISGIYSLGPYIKPFGMTLYTPVYWFWQLADVFRFSSRYQLITYFCLITVMALGLDRILQAMTVIPKTMIASIVMGALVVEWGAFSPEYVFKIRGTMPSVYHYLSQDPEVYPIAEMPATWYRTRIYLQSYIPFHHKKTQGDYPGQKILNILDSNDQRWARKHKLKYWAVSLKLPPMTSYPLNTKSAEAGFFNFTKLHRFGYMQLEEEWDDSLLYSFTSDFTPYAYWGVGFDLEQDSGAPSRWSILQTAEVNIEVEQDQDVQFTFTISTIGEPKEVRLSIEGKTLPAITVTNQAQVHTLTLPLKAPRTAVVFRLLSPMSNIADVIGNEDHRYVGIYVGKFAVVTMPTAASLSQPQLAKFRRSPEGHSTHQN